MPQVTRHGANLVRTHKFSYSLAADHMRGLLLSVQEFTQLIRIMHCGDCRDEIQQCYFLGVWVTGLFAGVSDASQNLPGLIHSPPTWPHVYALPESLWPT